MVVSHHYMRAQSLPPKLRDREVSPLWYLPKTLLVLSTTFSLSILLLNSLLVQSIRL